MNNENDISVTLEVIAEHVSLTPRRVQQLANEGVFIKSTVNFGQYMLLASSKGYIKYLQEISAGRSSSNSRDDVNFEIARKLKRKNDIDEQLSIKTADVVHLLRSIFNVIREHFANGHKGLAQKVTGVTSQAHVQQIMREHNIKTLKAIQDELKSFGVLSGSDIES